MIRPQGWVEGQCWIIDCHANLGVWIPLAQIRCSVLPDLFGLPDRPHSYAEWERTPAFAGVCQAHYRRLRTKHGTELGYTMRHGQVRRFVKDTYF